VKIVLDAYALIAFLLDEPAAGDVEQLLHRQPAAITSINYAEVLDRLVRGQGMPRDAVTAAVAPLLGERLERIDVDFRIAGTAASLRARHYHRTACPLSLADCVCLAAAHDGGHVATADEPMLRTARAEGIPVVPLASAAA